MAIGKAKEVKASERVKQAQIDKIQKLEDLNSKIDALKIQSKEATKYMGEAARNEDLSEYSKYKEEKRAADDAIDFYQERLDALSNASLFGKDTHAIISGIQREQNQITNEAMAKIVPLLDQVYEIADKARTEYLAIGKLIPTVCEHSGANIAASNPDAIVGVIRAIGFYIDNKTRTEKWNLPEKK